MLQPWFIDGPGGFIIEITIIQIVLLLIETACQVLFHFYYCFAWAKRGKRYAGKHL